jgi:hypothetical protein|tara:strand:- start:35 stop:391 length:357 start_codon:yes stop_codon:yes gene_type:complete
MTTTPYFTELQKKSVRTSKLRSQNNKLAHSMGKDGFSIYEINQITETESFVLSRYSLKERLIKTGIKQSLIIKLLGIHQSDLSSYLSEERIPTPEIKEKIESIIIFYEKALTQIKAKL